MALSFPKPPMPQISDPRGQNLSRFNHLRTLEPEQGISLLPVLNTSPGNAAGSAAQADAAASNRPTADTDWVTSMFFTTFLLLSGSL